MPLDRYGVVKGRPLRHTIEAEEDTPHFDLLIAAGETRFRASVNVRSAFDGSELLSVIADDLRHPRLDELLALPPGFTDLPSRPGGLALDYQRGHLIDRRRVRPARARHQGGRLPELLAAHVGAAIADPTATVYAFGDRWGPKPQETDRTFPDAPIWPSDGVHDVHMNQGNADLPGPRDDRLIRQNGVWQDGGLLLHFGGLAEWTGIFLAFRAQSWHTDDETGQPVEVGDGREPGARLRIAAALVNAPGPEPEAETVTLLNPTPDAVELAGWALLNTERRPTRLAGVIPAHGTLVVPVDPAAPLRNRGGTISLLDAAGVLVHGVAYTHRQAARDGHAITFTR